MEDAVYWMETGGRTDQRKVSLNAAPVNIADGLRKHSVRADQKRGDDPKPRRCVLLQAKDTGETPVIRDFDPAKRVAQLLCITGVSPVQNGVRWKGA